MTRVMGHCKESIPFLPYPLLPGLKPGKRLPSAILILPWPSPHSLPPTYRPLPLAGLQ